MHVVLGVLYVIWRQYFVLRVRVVKQHHRRLFKLCNGSHHADGMVIINVLRHLTDVGEQKHIGVKKQRVALEVT